MIVVSSTLHCRITRALFRGVRTSRGYGTSVKTVRNILPSCAPLNVTSLLPRGAVRCDSSCSMLMSKGTYDSARREGTVLGRCGMGDGYIRFSSVGAVGRTSLHSVFAKRSIICVCRGRVSTHKSGTTSRGRIFATYRRTVRRVCALVGEVTSRTGACRFVIATSRKFVCGESGVRTASGVTKTTSGSGDIKRHCSVSSRRVGTSNIYRAVINGVLNGSSRHVISFPLTSSVFGITKTKRGCIRNNYSPRRVVMPVVSIGMSGNGGRADLTRVTLMDLASGVAGLVAALSFIRARPMDSVIGRADCQMCFVSSGGRGVSGRGVIVTSGGSGSAAGEVFELHFGFGGGGCSGSRGCCLITCSSGGSVRILHRRVVVSVTFTSSFKF